MGWIQDRIRKNWGSKAVALMVAIALWLSFGPLSVGEEAIEAAVRFVNIPDALETNPDQIPSVTAMLRGPRATLSRLRSGGLTLVVDCEGVYGPGQHTANIDREAYDCRATWFVKARRRRCAIRWRNRPSRRSGSCRSSSAKWSPATCSTAIPPARACCGFVPEDRIALIEAVQTDPVNLRGEVGGRSFETTAFLSTPICASSTVRASRCE